MNILLLGTNALYYRIQNNNNISFFNGLILELYSRGDQTTLALRLIMRSSKTGRKTSSVASAVWHVAPSSCTTEYRTTATYPSLTD